MNKIILSASGIGVFLFYFATQLSVTSCTKEVMVHDTTRIVVRDTIKIHDTTYREDILAKHINDSLWAYYPVNGNLLDSSGHNHTLSLFNGAALTYDGSGNDFGAIDFNGSGQYGLIQDGKLFPASNFSVSFLVMPRENRGLFFGKHNYDNAMGASFNVGIDVPTLGNVARFSLTSNQANICNEGPNGGQYAMNKRAFNVVAWYLVTITFNNGTMKLYVNGTLMSTKQTTITQINNCSNSPFVLASWWAQDNNNLNGKMDELRIYTRAITDNEAKYLFNKCSADLARRNQ